ncbi:hypothetical protein OIO90_005219 [Microbotryomycetes sp. JL221]|nr:hypothetical protein OIO90_005219 [Microbotryomycetes sp. JL221]
MKSNELTEQHVIRLVHHLFNPTNPPSRSSTRRLVSRRQVTLSINDHSSTQASSSLSQTARKLSLLHLPSWIINECVPGCQWLLDSIENVENLTHQIHHDDKDDSFKNKTGLQVFQIDLNWKIQINSKFPLLNQTKTLSNQIEFWFWNESKDSEEGSGLGLNISTDHSNHDHVKLHWIKYNTCFQPFQVIPIYHVLKSLPLYDWINEKIHSLLIDKFCSILFGVSLLFGLNRSTQSLDQVAKQEKRKQRRRLRMIMLQQQQQQQQQYKVETCATRDQDENEFVNKMNKGKQKQDEHLDQIPIDYKFEFDQTNSSSTSCSPLNSPLFAATTTTSLIDTPPTPHNIALPLLSDYLNLENDTFKSYQRVNNLTEDDTFLSSLGDSCSQPDLDGFFDQSLMTTRIQRLQNILRDFNQNLVSFIQFISNLTWVWNEIKIEFNNFTFLISDLIQFFVYIFLNFILSSSIKVLKLNQNQNESFSKIENEFDFKILSSLKDLIMIHEQQQEQEDKELNFQLNRREKMRQHVEQKMNDQSIEIEQEDEVDNELKWLPTSRIAYSPSLWRSHEQTGRKRVSFSLEQAWNPYNSSSSSSSSLNVNQKINFENQSSKSIQDFKPVDSISINNNNTTHQLNSIENQSKPTRYHQDFGLPLEIISNPDVVKKNLIIKQIVLKSIQFKPWFEKNYSGGEFNSVNKLPHFE